MRNLVITCADDTRYDCPIEDNEQIELTDEGALKVTGPDAGVLKTLDSPVVTIHELVLVTKRPGAVEA